MTRGQADPIRFSVIVASRDRPVWLRRCLKALSQLDYSCFEIVVVAEHETLRDLDVSGVKLVAFNEANLSRARNAGISVAAGEFCVFIDDDAVPEPTWLQHLSDGLRATNADAAVGYVRGRNGISFQSQTCSVDSGGMTYREKVQTEAIVPELPQARALKLVGTNMAIRRTIFDEIGGFDEEYRYYLEDTDMSLRLARAGYAAAVVPPAEVHHAVAPSPRRTGQRSPADLFDVGRSTCIYLRRHKGGNFAEHFKRVQQEQKARLVGHMVQGNCEPRDIRRLLHGLRAGWNEGLNQQLSEIPFPSDEGSSFLAFPAHYNGDVTITSLSLFRRRSAMRDARRFAELGQRVSLFSFSLTPFRHRVHYSPDGVWIQTGGLFGKSLRSGPFFRWCRFARRATEEVSRVANVRKIVKKEAVSGGIDCAATRG